MSNILRRSFLGSAGAAVIYSLVPSAQAQSWKYGPNDAIRLGFIGVGVQGSGLLEEFKQIPGVTPTIACDLYDGYLLHAKEAMNGKMETTKDYRAVLDRKDIDAVVIATPDHLHFRMVLDALDAGKHVYIEKPLTWSLEEGAHLIRAEKNTGKLLQVGSQAKSSALTARAKQLVKDGALGKVNMIRMSNNRNSAEGAWRYPIPPDASTKTIDWPRFLGHYPQRPYDAEVFFRWRCWWEFSGGVATDLFVHLLTHMHELMDVHAPVSAVSQGGLYKWKDGRTVPDVMNSLFEYEEGFVIDMYVNLCNSRSGEPTTIMGDKATMIVQGRQLTVIPEPDFGEAQRYGSRAWPKAMRDEYLRKNGVTVGASGEQFPQRPAAKEQVIPVEAGPSHYEHFILSLRNGKPSVENATEGHYAAAGAHLANMSFRDKCKASWDRVTGAVSLS
ncbi:MAG: Gfo/Idh/MocA family oxidoreductase [Bryobacterales bacterium]|jgi:predicted dehydrogenase|nr:Gfo/Idh/MocA family oxidoreductase [Bryobacterales bacterium]